MPGLINLDFADIRTVMSEMGKAMMGTGEGSGEGRATHAAEAAISNPLLDEVSLKGARAMLINITAGPDLALFEVDEVVNRVRAEVDVDANVIFGSTFEPSMEGKVRVSVVATGMDAPTMHAQRPPVLEVIRGGGDAGRAAPAQAVPRPPVSMEDLAIPPSAPEPAMAEPAAEVAAVAPELAPAPTSPAANPPGLAVNTGFQVRPGGFVTPEPKRTFSLFERLTGVARRESNEDS
jgi:cell division protein FtsZ